MIESITISPQRSIGDLDIQCTIREQHRDDMAVTDHPVEHGADISDHAYKQPAQLVLDIGFSNSSEDAAGDEGYVTSIYEQLRALQNPPQLLEVVTGKRSYQNMLITSIAVVTDEKTEAVLAASVTLREIITVSTQTTTLPDSANQANPSKTAPVQDSGTIQAVPSAVAPTGSGG